MARTLEEAQAEAKRLGAYYPYRIIWVKEVNPNLYEVYADKTTHRKTRAMKDGFKVYELKSSREKKR